MSCYSNRQSNLFSDGTVKSRDIQVSLADFPKEVKERNPATARAAEYWLYKTLRVNFKQVPTLMGIGMLLRDERNIINPLRVPLVQQDNSGTARLVYFDSNGEHSDTIFGTGVRLSEAFEEKYMAESKEIWDLLVTIGAGNTDLREMLQTCNSVLKSGGIDVNGQPLRESSAQEGDGIGFIHWFRHYHESTVHRRSKATILSQDFDYKIPAEIQQISRSALKLAGSAHTLNPPAGSSICPSRWP